MSLSLCLCLFASLLLCLSVFSISLPTYMLIKVVKNMTQQMFDLPLRPYSQCLLSYLLPFSLTHVLGKSCDMWSFGVVIYMLLCGYAVPWLQTCSSLFLSFSVSIFLFKCVLFVSFSLSRSLFVCLCFSLFSALPVFFFSRSLYRYPPFRSRRKVRPCS